MKEEWVIIGRNTKHKINNYWLFETTGDSPQCFYFTVVTESMNDEEVAKKIDRAFKFKSKEEAVECMNHIQEWLYKSRPDSGVVLEVEGLF